jgi:hypothetical protein
MPADRIIPKNERKIPTIAETSVDGVGGIASAGHNMVIEIPSTVLQAPEIRFSLHSTHDLGDLILSGAARDPNLGSWLS